MQQPSLIIIAGCNGSGKSTFSSSIVGGNLVPFDYDKRFLEHYNALRDSEFREKFAIDKTTCDLENLIHNSFANLQSVCFETNFVNVPMNWINKAKELGYQIELYFFCLNSIDKAKERVALRVKNMGHFVEDDIVEFKWKEGYKNLNLHFQLTDKLLVLDNSKDASIPKLILELKKIAENNFEIIVQDILPDYLKRRMPNIFSLIDNGVE